MSSAHVAVAGCFVCDKSLVLPGCSPPGPVPGKAAFCRGPKTRVCHSGPPLLQHQGYLRQGREPYAGLLLGSQSLASVLPPLHLPEPLLVDFTCDILGFQSGLVGRVGPALPFLFPRS